MSLSCMGAVKLCGPREMLPYYVLLMIADEADDFGLAIVGLDTLAYNCRCNERTAMRAVEKLEADGWIAVRRRLWKNKCNVYFLNLKKIGVTESPDSKVSSFHLTLRRLHGDSLSPIFTSKDEGFGVPPPNSNKDASNSRDSTVSKSVDKPVDSFFAPQGIGDSEEISGDFPQGEQVTLGREQVTFTTGIGDKLSHPSRMSRLSRDCPAANAVPEELPPTPLTGGEKNSSSCEKTSPASAVEKTAASQTAKPQSHEIFEGDFQLLKTRLKQEIKGQPSHSNFREIIAGQDDYESCFREWWFSRIEMPPGTKKWLCRTVAPNVNLTFTGVEKYHARLERLARECFTVPRDREVFFVVRDLKTDEQQAA